jgi:hypothetical protein
MAIFILCIMYSCILDEVAQRKVLSLSVIQLYTRTKIALGKHLLFSLLSPEVMVSPINRLLPSSLPATPTQLLTVVWVYSAIWFHQTIV